MLILFYLPKGLKNVPNVYSIFFNVTALNKDLKNR